MNDTKLGIIHTLWQDFKGAENARTGPKCTIQSTRSRLELLKECAYFLSPFFCPLFYGHLVPSLARKYRTAAGKFSIWEIIHEYFYFLLIHICMFTLWLADITELNLPKSCCWRRIIWKTLASVLKISGSFPYLWNCLFLQKLSFYLVIGVANLCSHFKFHLYPHDAPKVKCKTKAWMRCLVLPSISLNDSTCLSIVITRNLFAVCRSTILILIWKAMFA